MSDKLIRYANQRVPLHYITEDLFLVEDQVKLAQHLSAIPNKYYVQLFVKKFISLHEKYGKEVAEEIYELYCCSEVMMATKPPITELDTLIYTVNNKSIKVNESPNLLAGLGTTGLRTWEAALVLSEYILGQEISGTICEIGTGTGVVGMSLAVEPSNKVIFTDANTNLLENVSENLKLNNLGDNCKLHQLIWGPDSYIECDYLVAADVTYDTSILDDLIATIKSFLENGCKETILAATIRNESTITQFETTLTDQNLSWKILKQIDPKSINSDIWYRPETPPVSIYSIKK